MLVVAPRQHQIRCRAVLNLLREINARLAKIEAQNDTDRIAAPIEDAQRFLGCGRTQIYALLRGG